MFTLFQKKIVLHALLGNNKNETMHCITYFVHQIIVVFPMWHSWKQQNEIVHWD
jgi:hypothetical protein